MEINIDGKLCEGFEEITLGALRAADCMRELAQTINTSASALEPLPKVSEPAQLEFVIPATRMLELLRKAIDRQLQKANTHPKWWHYYKHSKKARTRKKYRYMLERQATAALTGEKEEP